MRDKNIQNKLLDLSKRAGAIKSDPKLRHTPNGHDVSVCDIFFKTDTKWGL